MKKSLCTASVVLAGLLMAGCAKPSTDNVSVVNVTASDTTLDGNGQSDTAIGNDLGADNASGNAL